MVDIIYPDESYTIMSACFNVYNRDTDRSQAFNYLKVTEHKLCILANFCSRPRLEYERIIL
jgi:hypothetical protein